MTDTLEYGPLKEENWKHYRDLWLEALKESPESFAADYREQSDLPDSVWKERLADAIKEESVLVVFAHIGDQAIGMIGAYFDDNPKFRHVATVWGAYVRPAYRGKGIARELVNQLLKRLSERPGIVKVKSYSVTTGHMAVTAYKNFGFDIVGIAKKEIQVGDAFCDVYIMEKFLR
jgi:ribosomal protein S18 acetylase RimI-like enzyme